MEIFGVIIIIGVAGVIWYKVRKANSPGRLPKGNKVEDPDIYEPPRR